MTREDGFSLVELLIAMSIMVIVLLATMMALDTFGTASRRNQDLSDALDRARGALDTIAREMRNATAYQTSANATQSGVLRATGYDLVVKTVDPAGGSSAGNSYGVQTIRYCLNTTTGVLFRQRKADAVLPATACPDATWSGGALAAGIANGPSRAPFSYDSSTLSDISQVQMDVFVSVPSAKTTKETELTSGVFLRNQNRKPTAAFTATPGPNGHVQLNGSSSIDPEGRLLQYTWLDGTTQLGQTAPVVDYVTTAGSHTFTLTVTDLGGLTDTTTQTVTVQS
jgi:prepilin-type N-terminal cleavage/methylation domain-containing protein